MSLIVRETGIKTPARDHLPPIKMDAVEKSDKCWLGRGETGASCPAGGRPRGTRRGGASETERGVLPGCRGPASGLCPGGRRAGTPRAFTQSRPRRHGSQAPKVGVSPPGDRDTVHTQRGRTRRGRTLRTSRRAKRASHRRGRCVTTPRVRHAWARRGGEEGGRQVLGGELAFTGAESPGGG